MAILSTHHIVKRYHRRNVVDGVSVTINTGEIVGLLGPNGAGKTTSFYMIVGLISPDEGDIRLDNEDITHLPMHERARLGIGYLPQEPSIFRKLTVAENLLAVLELRKELTHGQRELIAGELLEEFSVGHLRNQPAMGLSGGERRRVEIARALACEPRFMLLDEPFAGVDPISIIDIQKIIVHLRARGIGILITEHNVRETLGTCDRAYILAGGRVIAEGSAEEIIHNPEVRQVYLGENFSM
ncbi:MAG: LPS export ABC transporter ATP-binding protein [Gammaproteobacteria bacterium]|jgi:lipopolysaccharide export system ATP-binding protein|nr:LPS export ABC transporter ATP-binding protein [Gammaproteobacteria bacterium]NBT44159.1 LPS export ABC transporter ATP-binding protein [Gammaproteobacteria bacterium]NBY22782.1 LPS export ABC transporter ATP-binding protein [Gammaproteobacteria bacterium]NDE33942.1 LPS export ABC transporter ATP-binding protein [Gammaproteobacteria bacterium]NDE56235.1 LPS export ABC transporter ATP-binding protein [Gammaproteobacteria bacterium]